MTAYFFWRVYLRGTELGLCHQVQIDMNDEELLTKYMDRRSLTKWWST